MPVQNDVLNQSFFAPPTSPLPPKKEVYNGEHAFYELYRERQLLSHKLGCGRFQLFAIREFKTHLESHLVLLSRGMEKMLLISSICLQKGNPTNFYLILNFQG